MEDTELRVSDRLLILIVAQLYDLYSSQGGEVRYLLEGVAVLKEGLGRSPFNFKLKVHCPAGFTCPACPALPALPCPPCLPFLRCLLSLPCLLCSSNAPLCPPARSCNTRDRPTLPLASSLSTVHKHPPPPPPPGLALPALRGARRLQVRLGPVEVDEHPSHPAGAPPTTTTTTTTHTTTHTTHTHAHTHTPCSACAVGSRSQLSGCDRTPSPIWCCRRRWSMDLRLRCGSNPAQFLAAGMMACTHRPTQPSDFRWLAAAESGPGGTAQANAICAEAAKLYRENERDVPEQIMNAYKHHCAKALDFVGFQKRLRTSAEVCIARRTVAAEGAAAPAPSFHRSIGSAVVRFTAAYRAAHPDQRRACPHRSGAGAAGVGGCSLSDFEGPACTPGPGTAHVILMPMPSPITYVAPMPASRRR